MKILHINALVVSAVLVGYVQKLLNLLIKMVTKDILLIRMESKPGAIKSGLNLIINSMLSYLELVENRHIFYNRNLSSTKIYGFLKPDIIHLHNLLMGTILISKYFNIHREKDIPTVLTLHDCWYLQESVSIIRSISVKWKEECHHCPRVQ